MKLTRTKLLLSVSSIALWAQMASAFYDPSIGRWITRDPIEESDGPNVYAFCANHPTGSVDPDGTKKMGNHCDASKAYKNACLCWATLVGLGLIDIGAFPFSPVGFGLAYEWCCNGFPGLPGGG